LNVKKKLSPGRRDKPVPASKAGTKREAAAPSPRRWLFRLFAVVVIPLVALMAVEFGLRVGGYGHNTSFFIKSPVDSSFWVENSRFSQPYFPEALLRPIRPLSIPARKPDNVCRIFVFGESAAEGDPKPALGFARILEVLLRDQFPEKKIEVINTAVTAINSHVILPIARDASSLQGDFWIFYMGNNEVVGPFGAGTVFGRRAPSRTFIRTGTWLKTTRLGQLLDSLQQSWQKNRGTINEWGGMEMFLSQRVAPGDPRLLRVYDHLEKNLSDLFRLGIQSGARVIGCTVAGNLKDCAPFASLHRPELTEAEQGEWEKLYQAGVALEEIGNPAGALEQFRQAARIDHQFAVSSGAVGYISKADDLDKIVEKVKSYL